MPEEVELTNMEILLASRVKLLESVLKQQGQLHTQMLEMLNKKRDAIARADMIAISTLSIQENELLRLIGKLEVQRLNLVGEITEAVDSNRSQPMTMSEIAECVKGEAADRLRVIASQVREKVKNVQSMCVILNNAAEALSNHIAGIMQTVHSALCQANIYERHGKLAYGAQMRSAVDITL